MSLVAVIALIGLVVGVVGGRASGGTSSGDSAGGAGGAAAGKRVDVIIKASDSEFWQSMLAGAKKAGDDYGLEVGLFGPTSETDVNQQVQLVENSISRGVDAIVGSVLGLTGCVTAQLLVEGMPVPLAIVAGLLIGVVLGLINGGLVAYGKLPPFIVTLGMLGIARGVVLVLTDASTVQPLPDSFGNIANGDFLGLPNLLWIFMIVVVVTAFVLRRTVFGRYIYAVGSNPESARLSGVPVTAVLVSVYSIAGLLAAVGGVLFASRLNAGIPTAGTGYELNAIAACVIGGASLFGAKGGAFGAAAGALIVATLNNGGNLLAVNAFYLQIIIGALILIAVAFDQWQSRAK